jgi:hypothetical protein
VIDFHEARDYHQHSSSLVALLIANDAVGVGSGLSGVAEACRDELNSFPHVWPTERFGTQIEIQTVNIFIWESIKNAPRGASMCARLVIEKRAEGLKSAKYAKSLLPVRCSSTYTAYCV